MLNDLNKKDWWWILALPIYILIGTFRHEVAHAVMALLQGATIQKFVFWPTWSQGFNFGMVVWHGEVNWLVTAAPYLCDLATFAFFYFICAKFLIKPHALYVNIFIIGMVSPLVNSVYNYLKLFMARGDVYKLVQVLPNFAVHEYFVLTIALYASGIIYILKRSKLF